MRVRSQPRHQPTARNIHVVLCIETIMIIIIYLDFIQLTIKDVKTKQEQMNFSIFQTSMKFSQDLSILTDFLY